MEKEILQGAIATFTDKPWPIKVTPQPRTRLNKILFKLGIRKPKTKTYYLHNPSAGNMYRISGKIIEIPKDSIRQGTDMVIRDMFNLAINSIDRVAYIVATGITNSREEPPQWLIDELIWDSDEKELREAANQMVKMLDVAGFMSTIVSMIGLDIVTPAKQTSPTVPGE